jgi:hypothetical protein
MNEREFTLEEIKDLTETIYGMKSKEAIEAQNKLIAKIRKERDRKMLEQLLWKDEARGRASDEA